MSIESGTILEVRIVPTGTELSSDHTTGSNHITVEEPYFFDENGGTLDIDGVLYTYTGYDDTTRQIQWLSPSLSGNKDAGTKVLVYPYGSTKKATVQLDDEEDALQVIIPFHEYEKYNDGIRDDTEQESVTISDENGYWEIAGTDEENPVIQGVLIRTGDEGNRVEIWADDTDNGFVDFYSGIEIPGNPNYAPGRIWSGIDDINSRPEITIISPRSGVVGYPSLNLQYTGEAAGRAALIGREGIIGYGNTQIEWDHDTGIIDMSTLTGVLLNSGANIRGIDFGERTGTTDANGDLNTSHNLNGAPISVLTLNAGNLARTMTVTAVSGSNFTIRARAQDASILANTSVTFYWLAIR